MEINELTVDKKRNTAVSGVFTTRFAVDGAVDALKNGGFRNSDISFVMPDPKPAEPRGSQKKNKSAEGASIGAATGALAGGGIGWLAGVGAFILPLLSSVVASGPVAAAVAGVGIGGVTGGLTGALIGMGMNDCGTKGSGAFVNEGGILLSVRVDDCHWETEAKNLLGRCGAYDIACGPEESPGYPRR